MIQRSAGSAIGESALDEEEQPDENHGSTGHPGDAPCGGGPGAEDRAGTVADDGVERAAGDDDDPDAVGLTFEALVFVTMRQEDRDTLLGFEEAVAAIPNVLQAQRLFGDPDYLIRVRTTDLAAYAELEDNTLSAIPGVQRLNSTLVMKLVVSDRAIPT